MQNRNKGRNGSIENNQGKQSREKETFFTGEVFFPLTGPLMGDPNTLRVHLPRKITFANHGKIR
jgi:hypothetical protein